MKRLHLLLLGLSLLLSFTIFSRYIKRGAMSGVDFAVTIKVQERIDKSSRLRLARLNGKIMEGASFLASPGFSIIVITVITIITVIKKKRWQLTALVIPLAFGLMTIAEIYGKSVVHHPAPPFFLLKNPTTVFPKYYVWEDYSYPSGHAARAVFLGLVLFFLLKKRRWTVIGLGSYIALISISRIYLGHHWLSDVLGGGLVGSAFGFIAASVL